MWPVQSVAQAPDVIWWSISGNVKWQTTASLWFTSLTHWAHFNCVSYHHLRLTLPAELHIVLCVRRICLVISTKLARVAFCDVCRNVAAIYCDMFGRNLRPWSLLFAEFLLVLFIYSRFSLPDLISLFLLAHFRVSTTPGNPGNLLEICSVKSVDTLHLLLYKRFKCIVRRLTVCSCVKYNDWHFAEIIPLWIIPVEHDISTWSGVW